MWSACVWKCESMMMGCDSLRNAGEKRGKIFWHLILYTRSGVRRGRMVMGGEDHRGARPTCWGEGREGVTRRGRGRAKGSKRKCTTNRMRKRNSERQRGRHREEWTWKRQEAKRMSWICVFSFFEVCKRARVSISSRRRAAEREMNGEQKRSRTDIPSTDVKISTVWQKFPECQLTR